MDINSKPNFVVVAQTPPPFHGQSVMQQYLVNAKWDWCVKNHIRMKYSNSIKHVGKFQISKLFKIFVILYGILKSRISSRIDVFYYPPSGPHRIPLYRDIVTLLFARLFVRKIILHFHAGGLADKIIKLSAVERLLVNAAFKKVYAAVVLLPWLEKEVQWINPKHLFTVPNGIDDIAGTLSLKHRNSSDVCNILFVGNLKDEKGIFVLLSAASILKFNKRKFLLQIMGASHSETVSNRIDAFIIENDLQDNVVLLGTKSGDEKWAYFKSSHIFCLPTFDSEAMPVSILEAMMFSLAIVTTNWRAVPDMIQDDSEALLCEIKNPLQLSNKLTMLIDQPDLADNLGKAARERFESEYTIARHLDKMQILFKKVHQL